MKLHISDGSSLIQQKYVYFDNDVLFSMSQDPLFSESILTHCTDAFPIVDPLTRFEFLRDLYNPRQLIIKEKFLSPFLIATAQSEHVQSVQKNALIISQIYSLTKKAHVAQPSYVDLMLAGSIMAFAKTSVLLTRNRKDFPSCLFDIDTLLSLEEGNGMVKNYYILCFNEIRFHALFSELEGQKYHLSKKS